MVGTCLICGSDYKAPPSAFRKGRKTCSMRCRSVAYQGEGNPNWRGGRVTDPSGRVMVYAPGNPDARLFGGTHIYEYRIVAATKIGRPLRADEIVHHVNGDPTDNRPENLEVMTQGEHLLAHRLPEISAQARQKGRA